MKKLIMSITIFLIVFTGYYAGAQIHAFSVPEVDDAPLPCTAEDKSMGCDMTPFPEAKTGVTQYVISLPPKEDEHAFRVGLFVGRTQQTDGVNLVRLAGELKKKTIPGWGYDYYEVAEISGNDISTRMAPMPERSPITEYVAMPEKLVRYNSRLPLVIYVPADFEVQYRVYTAGSRQIANTLIERSKVKNLSTDKVHLNVSRPVELPAGATATLRLYDALLADTDSTYGISTVPLKTLPITIALPVAKPSKRIAGPAVRVMVKDRQGQLLYLSDTATMLNDEGVTVLNLVKAR